LVASGSLVAGLPRAPLGRLAAGLSLAL